MNIKIADLMVKNVVTTEPHKSIGHVKDIMTKNRIVVCQLSILRMSQWVL